ncbi:MAG: hypothetical protein ACT4OK_22430 [Gemmobacter sp.]
MALKLHANATTTPRARALIQARTASGADLARQFGITETSVRRWRGRTEVHDRPHTCHNLGQSTTRAEEALIAVLRRDLGLSPDDLALVMQRCVNPGLSRSAVDRCPRRHGLSAAAPPDAPAQPSRPASRAFSPPIPGPYGSS